ELAAEAVEAEFDSAEADPLPTAEDARAARHGLLLGGDADADRAAKIDPVGAVVEIDQDGERVTGAGLPARRFGDDLGGLAADLGPVVRQTEHVGDLADVAGDKTAAEDALGAWHGRDARRDLAAGEHFDDGERAALAAQRVEDDAFERVVVLGEDKIAEPLADLGNDRNQLCFDVDRVGAAHRQLGLDLRVMRAKAELRAAVGHQRLDPLQQLVDVAFAKPVRMKAL